MNCMTVTVGATAAHGLYRINFAEGIQATPDTLLWAIVHTTYHPPAPYQVDVYDQNYAIYATAKLSKGDEHAQAAQLLLLITATRFNAAFTDYKPKETL